MYLIKKTLLRTFLRPLLEPKFKPSPLFDIYEFDIRPLEYMTFPYISKYLERLSKSTGKQRLTLLRCVSTLMGDLHRLFTNNNSSISSIGMIKKRFQTHTAPTTLQTQQIRDDHEEDLEENNDDKLDSMTYESFEMFFLQVIITMKSIHTFMSATNVNQSMDTDDDIDNLIDRDQSRDLASRAFGYALDSLYFLLSLFKVKQSNWQKEIDRDSTCLTRLINIIVNHLLNSKRTTARGKEENERVQILKKFFSFADILNLIDCTRLCQSLELFIQLFEEETDQVSIMITSFHSWIFPSRTNFIKSSQCNVVIFWKNVVWMVLPVLFYPCRRLVLFEQLKLF